jgi:SAM-dependent methyltransferase
MISAYDFDMNVTRYDDVAPEYYNPAAHPTCKNFRDASLLFMERNLNDRDIAATVLDIGAGASVLAEILVLKNLSLHNLVLIDRSEQMLRHSWSYTTAHASLLIADARALPIRTGSANLIAASLGDPFNVEPFWSEAERCLRHGGKCLFTTPSFEWAKSFRSQATHEREAFAYFELRDGRGIYVPSIVHSVTDQLKLCSRHRLVPVSIEPIFAADLPLPLSPKLVRNRAQQLAVVTGYHFVRE